MWRNFFCFQVKTIIYTIRRFKRDLYVREYQSFEPLPMPHASLRKSSIEWQTSVRDLFAKAANQSSFELLAVAMFYLAAYRQGALTGRRDMATLDMYANIRTCPREKTLILRAHKLVACKWGSAARCATDTKTHTHTHEKHRQDQHTHGPGNFISAYTYMMITPSQRDAFCW